MKYRRWLYSISWYLMKIDYSAELLQPQRKICYKATCHTFLIWLAVFWTWISGILLADRQQQVSERTVNGFFCMHQDLVLWHVYYQKLGQSSRLMLYAANFESGLPAKMQNSVLLTGEMLTRHVLKICSHPR